MPHAPRTSVTASASSSSLTTYPRRYFDLSPTWFTWNRMTAVDLANLRAHPQFEGQSIYFYGNYPIRFVRIVGVVVETESFANGKYTLVHLDDGSGEIAVIKITRIEKVREEILQALRNRNAESKSGEEQDPSGFDRYTGLTAVEGLIVQVQSGLPTICLRGTKIEIGTILRAKGTLSMFRQVLQVELKMLAIVKNTTEEYTSWTDTAKWKAMVLSKPWVLSQEEMDAFDEKMRQDLAEMAVKERQKAKERAKLKEKRSRLEAAREAKRRQQEAEMNAGVLEGAETIRNPWD